MGGSWPASHALPILATAAQRRSGPRPSPTPRWCQERGAGARGYLRQGDKGKVLRTALQLGVCQPALGRGPALLSPPPGL